MRQGLYVIGALPMHGGLWTSEEVDLAKFLIDVFQRGLLENVPDGTKLGAWLPVVMNCTKRRLLRKAITDRQTLNKLYAFNARADVNFAGLTSTLEKLVAAFLATAPMHRQRGAKKVRRCDRGAYADEAPPTSSPSMKRVASSSPPAMMQDASCAWLPDVLPSWCSIDMSQFASLDDDIAAEKSLVLELDAWAAEAVQWIDVDANTLLLDSIASM
ncbi:hypothetical protein SPRG_12477 [Saprolegnia parasitica CBS 223.65]|uniref:Uncharacterized protein n=1 Tax=Saprolegnia parasitica (strain CBS 223.65) TaxID=695850 RepID=A0A067BTC3_SAPPC|nr:hypothetical protein SPRG_12477 [Saprolegnia parasitica CBS 223.65]KDO21513.1 hypothetical protein SPRG_12477 [Saprolegnia parasitica CBS 223.65]|eukprot:XP_012207780.1 hypothetical protein SPRG_12477 [Saprolegnia parasitica CBS 223.65]